MSSIQTPSSSQTKSEVGTTSRDESRQLGSTELRPIRLLIVGPSASGKSTLVKELLHTQFRGKFDHIYIIAPTIEQELWKSVKIRDEKKNKSDVATNEKFMEYIEIIKKNKEQGKSSLLILDDVVNTELTKHTSALCTEFLRIRHYNCSVVICSQNYKGVPPFIRVNVSHMIIFINPNRDEKKKMQQEIGDTFFERYTEIVKDPYQFCFVDYTKHELDQQRYTNRILF